MAFFIVHKESLMERYPITAEGYNRMEQELKDLKSVERPAVIKAIAEAREHGDLSENAEYHAAREKQSFIEGRIKELEARVSYADVINPKELDGNVKFGATVKLIDEDTEEEVTYQIVGEYEADLKDGKIALNAPIAKALIGKQEGDSIEVKTPKGVKYYEIEEVIFK
jgi:transcription elongation factor GreA